MRIAVCDNDKIWIDTVKAAIDQWLSISNLSAQIITFDNGDDLISENRCQPIDIVFLDIMMPLLNGIDTAKEIREFDEMIKIIFMSFSNEFAVASYKVEASNYLLKPFDYEELSRTLYKVTRELQKVESSIVIHTADGYKKVYLNEIEYVEASRKGTAFSLITGVLIRSVDPLYYIEQQLSIDKGFFKCHRSYIVNLLNIDAFVQSKIITKTGYKVPISRIIQKDFNKAYYSYNFR